MKYRIRFVIELGPPFYVVESRPRWWPFWKDCGWFSSLKTAEVVVENMKEVRYYE
jgi:hypothetical protein